MAWLEDQDIETLPWPARSPDLVQAVIDRKGAITDY
jgi:hypothetical protein